MRGIKVFLAFLGSANKRDGKLAIWFVVVAIAIV